MTIVPSLLFELWPLDQGSRPSTDGNFGSFEETGAYLTGGAVGTGTGRGAEKAAAGDGESRVAVIALTAIIFKSILYSGLLSFFFLRFFFLRLPLLASDEASGGRCSSTFGDYVGFA